MVAKVLRLQTLQREDVKYVMTLELLEMGRQQTIELHALIRMQLSPLQPQATQALVYVIPIT